MPIWPKKLSKEERISEHRRVRARGIGLFILFRGILTVGAIAFLIDLGENIFLEHRHIDLEFLMEKLLQWGATGVFWGWWMWRIEYDGDEDDA